MTSIILQTAMRLIVPLSLLFGIYMALKGHNEPGGGFIGGLIVALALALYLIAYGHKAIRRLIPFHPRIMVTLGLGLALITGLVPMFFQYPMLTSYVQYVDLPFGTTIHFASALFFDAGVLIVVIGVSIGMIMRLSEELEQE